MDDKEFIDYFEKRVEDTINRYNLIEDGEEVLVACSGGKDSTTALYLLNKFGYDPKAMTIDLLMGDYSKKNLKCIRKFCRNYNIPLHEISFRDAFGYSVCYLRSIVNLRDNTKSNSTLGSCTVCGVLKRYLLNKKARELGASKIVTAHNMDDEAQTIFMNLVQGQIERLPRLGPRTGQIKNKKFIVRIKPLYFCPENEVERYSRIMGFPVIYEPCPCSVNSYRSLVKEIIRYMDNKHPGTTERIVRNFLKIKPKLEQYYHNIGEIKYCKSCSEPSSQDICRTCDLRRSALTMDYGV